MKIVLSKQYWGIELNREHYAEVPILFGRSTIRRLREGSIIPIWLGYADRDYRRNETVFVLLPFNIPYRIGKRIYWTILGWLKRGGWFKFAELETATLEVFQRGILRGKSTGASEFITQFYLVLEKHPDPEIRERRIILDDLMEELYQSQFGEVPIRANPKFRERLLADRIDFDELKGLKP